MESKLAFMVTGRAKQWASFAMALCVGSLFSRKFAGFQRQPHIESWGGCAAFNRPSSARSLGGIRRVDARPKRRTQHWYPYITRPYVCSIVPYNGY